LLNLALSKPAEVLEDDEVPSEEYSADAQEQKKPEYKPKNLGIVPVITAVPDGCEATVDGLYASVANGFIDTEPHHVKEVFELSGRLPAIRAEFNPADGSVIIGLDCDKNTNLYRQLASELAGDNQ